MPGVRAKAALLVAATTTLALVSCGGGWGSCRTYVQNKLEFEPLTAGGSIQYSGDGFSITNERPVPVHTCNAELSMPQPFCGSGPSPSTAMSLDVSCAPVGGARPGFYSTLGDIRELEVGDYPLEATTSYGDNALYEVTLHVEASTGHGAEYPDFVTSDFSKALSVEVHSDFIDASLEFDLRADQFVSKPRQPCRVCLL